jgi:SAM-dependent methyltransferase
MMLEEIREMKLNLGCGYNWSKEGWVTLDHNVLKPFSLPRQAWDLPFEDASCEMVFCSHMIEHISHFRIEMTLAEINRIMKSGGVLRLLTPDLETLCKAYVERDMAKLGAYIDEDRSGIRSDLGPAQALLGFLYSPGYDNIMLESSRARIVGTYAHVYCYDFELLSGLLRAYGYSDVTRMAVDDSSIPEHKELRGCAHDVDRLHSLVVECRKERHVPFVLRQSLLFSGAYQPEQIFYGQKFVLPKVGLFLTAYLENFVFWAARLLKHSVFVALGLRKKAS